jgi:glycosyltransferase involved in cell wall biosynthesis
MRKRPTVLSLLGCYVPGSDASGPNQSFRAFAAGLSNDFEIRVASSADKCTSDRWYNDGFALVRQIPSGWNGILELRRVLHNTPYDLLMLNGFYDRKLTIPVLLLRRLGLIPSKPTIISVRGEFSDGALSLKSRRKRAWLAFVRAAGLTHGIWFHATAPHERADINRLRLPKLGVLDAPNAWILPAILSKSHMHEELPLRVVFIGRVSRVKNLHFAIDVLSKVKAPVLFDIYGPTLERAYHIELKNKIGRLPPHIEARFMGELRHASVAEVLSSYHLFFMPTLGENFGHAIVEALAQGLPVLISDATPWQGLEKTGGGWDISLNAPARFVNVIEHVAAASPTKRAAMRATARALAERTFAESGALKANRSMITTVLAGVKS